MGAGDGLRINPLTAVQRTVDGTIVGKSLVIKGSAEDDVAPVASANQAVIGYVADAGANNEQCHCLGDGSVVPLVSENTITQGDYVVAKSEVRVQTISVLNPSDKDLLNIVGRAESSAADGERVYIRLGMRAYNHAE